MFSSAALLARYWNTSYNFAFSLDSNGVNPLILNNPHSATFLIVKYQPYLSLSFCEAAEDFESPVVT